MIKFIAVVQLAMLAVMYIVLWASKGLQGDVTIVRIAFAAGFSALSLTSIATSIWILTLPSTKPAG